MFSDKVKRTEEQLTFLEESRNAYYLAIELEEQAKVKYEKAASMANRELSAHSKLLVENATRLFHRWNNSIMVKNEAKEVYLNIRSEVMGYVTNIKF